MPLEDFLVLDHGDTINFSDLAARKQRVLSNVRQKAKDMIVSRTESSRLAVQRFAQSQSQSFRAPSTGGHGPPPVQIVRPGEVRITIQAPASAAGKPAAVAGSGNVKPTAATAGQLQGAAAVGAAVQRPPQPIANAPVAGPSDGAGPSNA